MHIRESAHMSIHEVVLLIAFMSKKSYSHSTVRTYISAISYFHKLHGYQDPTAYFVVSKVLEGYRRDTGGRHDTRQPITLDVLRRILPVLDQVCTSNYEARLFRAAFSLAFFGFMRIGEITVSSKMSSRSSVLHRSDVSIRTLDGKQILEVVLRKSKNNQCGPPQIITIPATGNPETCGLSLMQNFLQVRSDSTSGILFCHFDGSPMTRYQFSRVLVKAATFAGFPGDEFKSHSFRIGAATSAAMAGIPDDQIKIMGRWKSNAYRYYIRVPNLLA